MTGALSRLTKDLIVKTNLHSNNIQGTAGTRCPRAREERGVDLGNNRPQHKILGAPSIGVSCGKGDVMVRGGLEQEERFRETPADRLLRHSARRLITRR